jgi:hypothetical protein
MTELGYERIGLSCFGGHAELFEHQHESAYAYFQRSNKDMKYIPPFTSSSYQHNDFWKWFRRYKPDAILSTFPGTLDELRKAGYNVPGQIGFALFGVIPESGDIAGIDVQARDIDRTIVDIVVSQIISGERGVPNVPRATYMEGVWRIGSTLRRQEKTK